MRTTWLGVAATVLVLVGCGKKDEECKTISDVATKDVAAIKVAAANKPAGSKDLAVAVRATADAADKLAADLSKKGPSTVELQKASGDYQAVAKEMSAATREWADLLDKLAAMEAKTRPEYADPDRKTLAADQDKIKKRCAEHPSPQCKALAPFLESAAAMKPEQLEKLEGDLGAIMVKDKDLAPLALTLRGSFAALAKTMRDAVDTTIEMKPVQAKAKAASDAFDAALAKEAALASSLKTFCK